MRFVFTFDTGIGGRIDVDKIHGLGLGIRKERQKIERFQLKLNRWIKTLSRCGRQVLAKGGVEFGKGGLKASDRQDSHRINGLNIITIVAAFCGCGSNGKLTVRIVFELQVSRCGGEG